MFSRENIRRVILPGIIFIIVSIIAYLELDRIAYKYYNKAMNGKIAYVVDTVKEKYPNISEEQIIKAINDKSIGNKETRQLLKEYGYNDDTNSYIKQISDNLWREKITIIMLIAVQGITIIALALINSKNKSKKIKSINT